VGGVDLVCEVGERAGCPGPEPRRTMRPVLEVGNEREWMVSAFRGLSALSSSISSSDSVASLERPVLAHLGNPFQAV